MSDSLKGTRFSEFLVTTEMLLQLAFRKGLYTITLLSVLAPVLLTIVLFSIPDFEGLSYIYANDGRVVPVFSSINNGEKCYPAVVADGFLVTGNSGLKTYILIVGSEPSRLLEPLGLARQYQYSIAVILPRDVYMRLGKPWAVPVLLDQVSRNYTVAGIWSSNIVLVIDQSLRDHDGYVCLVSRGDILLSALKGVERDLLDTATLWILLLSLVYLPIIYAAQRRIAESLLVDARVAFEAGASNRGILISTSVTLIVLHVIGVIHACTLGVVLVYTAWSLLGYVMPLPPPSPRMSIAQLLIAEIVLGALTAYPASRGAVEWR
jgi:hypothetical protein